MYNTQCYLWSTVGNIVEALVENNCFLSSHSPHMKVFNISGILDLVRRSSNPRYFCESVFFGDPATSIFPRGLFQNIIFTRIVWKLDYQWPDLGNRSLRTVSCWEKCSLLLSMIPLIGNLVTMSMQRTKIMDLLASPLPLPLGAIWQDFFDVTWNRTR